MIKLKTGLALSSQIISVIDFLYNDIEGPTDASVRFLTMERIVSDYMFTCSNEGFDYGRSYRYDERPSLALLE